MLKQNFQKQIDHVLFSSGEYHLVICLQMPYPCMSSSSLFNLQFLIALCAILRHTQAVSHIECYLWIMCLLLFFQFQPSITSTPRSRGDPPRLRRSRRISDLSVLFERSPAVPKDGVIAPQAASQVRYVYLLSTVTKE